MAKPINDQILDAFKKSGRTKYWLAKQTGLSASTIARWELSRSDLAVGNLQAIADALGVVMAVKSKSRRSAANTTSNDT